MPSCRSIVRAACVLSLATGLAASQAWSAPISDPQGDFLTTYTGPHNADLDIRSTGASFVAGNYVFDGTFYGTIGSTAGGLYVFGVDRGQGTPRFAAIGSAIVFDAVVIVNPFGTSSVRDLIANTSSNLAPDAVLIAGASLEVNVAGSLLPSTGFAADHYTYNLWPRSGLGNNNQIADFAPDNSNLAIDVPEPASTGILLVSLLALTGLGRRGRRTV